MPSDAPLITVITPAYNVAPYIREAVASVLGQTFHDFEYLIVDDGSTDGTLDILEGLAATDSRMRVLKADHGGATRARNLGLSQAKGSYIAFLDGDDRWSVEFLEKQLDAIKSQGSDVSAVFCRSRVMSEAGRVYLVRWQRSGKYDFDSMLIDSCPPRVGSSLLIKREAFDKAGHFDVELLSAQDLDMWLRIQRDSGMPYFYGTSDYLVDIRVRAGAISRDHRRRFDALDLLIRRYSSDLKHSHSGMAYVRAAVFAYRAADDERADLWAKEALKAGTRTLVRDGYGMRLLAWNRLSKDQREKLRNATTKLRALIGKAVGVAGGLKRWPRCRRTLKQQAAQRPP